MNAKRADKKNYDWISLGGGAAGYYGALHFAQLCPLSHCMIIEASSKTLRKVKISGGGRCNLTHSCFEPSKLSSFYPRGQKELISLFHKHGPRETLQWFAQRGVPTKTEEDGRIFPISNKSQSVIDCFEKERKKLQVSLKVEVKIQSIEKTPTGFVLSCRSGERYHTKFLLISTGSSTQSWNLLENMGHTVISPVPSLFSFNIEDPRLTDLPGLSFQNVGIQMPVISKNLTQGPLLITHWGLSGPSILSLSSKHVRSLYEKNYQTQLRINFSGNQSEDEIRKEIENMKSTYSQKNISTHPPQYLPKRYWERLLTIHGITKEAKWMHLSKKHIHKLCEQIHHASFSIEGKTTNKAEFVTSGGISRKEIDFSTMESKIIPKLFFAGEVIDVDGLTGGFNFQHAWSSSRVAATSAANMFS